jgi:hypothetical protein
VRPQILVADALLAMERLDVRDDQARAAVLRLLGLELGVESVPAAAAPDELAEPVPSSLLAPAVSAEPANGPARPAEAPIPSRIARLPDAEAEQPRPAVPDRPFPGPDETGDPPPYRPLLEPRWTRGIVSACVATCSPRGPIDVPAVVRRLARGLVLEELPRLSTPTTRHGLQVLVDLAPTMQPFASDQAALVAQLERVLGAHKTEVLYFADSPGNGAGPGHEFTWGDYEPPEGGVPVLLVTDFGIGRHREAGDAGVLEWLRVLARLGRARVPAVALVPYPRGRVPRTLLRAVPVVPWDRTTTVRTVRAVVGPVLEARR